MKNCMSNQGYSEKDDKFFVNLNGNNGINTKKELFKNCVSCGEFIGCNKKKELLDLLNENEKVINLRYTKDN